MKKEFRIEYEELEIAELSSEELELVERAKNITLKAYAPYSNFKVGCAIQFEDGTYVEGNNQENIAYPSGLCAERVALFYASANFPEKHIKALAVYAQTDAFDFDEIVKPCGACRQVMAEYEGKQKTPITVLLAGKSALIKLHKANDLLPFIFDASGLMG